MRIAQDITDVPSAGVAVQLSSSPDGVKSIEVRGHPDNTGRIALGNSTVSMTGGWLMDPGESKPFNFGNGSVKLSDFYVDAANDGDDAIWIAILE